VCHPVLNRLHSGKEIPGRSKRYRDGTYVPCYRFSV